MRVVVTGGAGYIGSHTVLKLIDAGHEPVIVDDFRSSKHSVIRRLETLADRDIPVYELDLNDCSGTMELFLRERPDGVIHFAGLKAVGESVAEPLKYYSNNLGSTLSVLDAMHEAQTKLFVFSSSATVYGGDAPAPMREDFPTSATNPYGWTKVMLEQILHDAARADPQLRVGVLRYFNPVGAHPSGIIGEDPQAEPKNLVPLLCQVAIGCRPELLIFGEDYPTSDGTARRDYIHVEDLAEGHVAALRGLTKREAPISTWNLGTGMSTSVREMVTLFSRVCGRDIRTRTVGRRLGDVAESFADPSQAAADLGWRAQRSITDMCVDAWRWQTHKAGRF